MDQRFLQALSQSGCLHVCMYSSSSDVSLQWYECKFFIRTCRW